MILVNIVHVFIYNPIIISELGKETFGVISLSLGIAAIFSPDVGFLSASNKMILEYKNKNNQIDKAVGNVNFIFILLSALSLIIYFALRDYTPQIATGFSESELDLLKSVLFINFIYLAFSILTKPFESLIYSLEHYEFLQYFDLISKISMMLMIIFLLNQYPYAETVFFIMLISYSLKIFLQLVLLFRKIKIKFMFLSFDLSFIKEFFKLSAILSVTSVSQRLIILLTYIVLANLADSGEVALFSLSVALEAYVFLVITIFTKFFLPKISNYFHTNKSIDGLLAYTSKVQILFTSAILIGFYVLGKDFILIWVGDQFFDVYIIFFLLTAHTILTIPFDLLQSKLLVEDKAHFRTIASVIHMVIALPLSIFLAKDYGAIGSALAIFIGAIFGPTIYMLYVYKKYLNVNVLSVLSKTVLKLSWVAFLFISLFSLIYSAIDLPLIVKFVVGLAIMSLYFIIAPLVLFTREQKQRIKRFILTRGKNF